MTPEQFCYWLQGFSEVNGSPPNTAQWKIIQDHIKQVFDKKTPVRSATPVYQGDVLGDWMKRQEQQKNSYPDFIEHKVIC